MAKLSEHAVAELREIDRTPVPCCCVNPGVVNKLLKEGLAEVVMLPNPFPSVRKKEPLLAHLQITDNGKFRIGKS